MTPRHPLREAPGHGETAQGAGRKRKAGPRTKSGHLSRAYKDPNRAINGTREFQAKRLTFVNGATPELAATASGILFANGHLDPGAARRRPALRLGAYVDFGRPWMRTSPLGELCATEPTNEIHPGIQADTGWSKWTSI